MHLYTLTHKICKIRFGIGIINKSKQILAESIFVDGVVKKKHANALNSQPWLL
jgi:hypothetical protein